MMSNVYLKVNGLVHKRRAISLQDFFWQETFVLCTKEDLENNETTLIHPDSRDFCFNGFNIDKLQKIHL